MAVLEGMVAAEAARRLSSADFSRLSAIHSELETHAAGNDADQFFDANQRFHSALQEISGNRYLGLLIDDARKVLKLTRRDSLRLAGRIARSLAEHRDILKALEARDPALARQRMQDHLLSGRQAVASLQTSQ